VRPARRRRSTDFYTRPDKNHTKLAVLTRNLLVQLLDLAPECDAVQETRVYINCPYHEKDEAKELGARWDREKRQWFVPQGNDKSPDISLFSQWL
jgi:hypothetical protein